MLLKGKLNFTLLFKVASCTHSTDCNENKGKAYIFHGHAGLVKGYICKSGYSTVVI